MMWSRRMTPPPTFNDQQIDISAAEAEALAATGLLAAYDDIAKAQDHMHWLSQNAQTKFGRHAATASARRLQYARDLAYGAVQRLRSAK